MNASEILARNLARLRKERGLTLTSLSELSGVSKAALSELEAGRGNPTLTTLWSLADALGVPFGALVSEATGEAVEVTEPGVAVRLLERSAGEPQLEVYSMRLAPGARREAVPHAPGVVERVMVIAGKMRVGPLGSPRVVEAGEAFAFAADQPHVYAAEEEAVVALVVMLYPRQRADEAADPSTTVMFISAPGVDSESITTVLRRACEEVAQGLPVRRLILCTAAGREAAVATQVEAALRGFRRQGYSWPLYSFVRKDTGRVSVFLFRRLAGYSRLWDPQAQEPSGPVLAQARLLVRHAAHVCRPLEPGEAEELRELTRSANLTVSTLASEVLTLAGEPTVPPILWTLIDDSPPSTDGTRNDASPMFEDRIDVTAHHVFELLHPAYARQPVALAELALRYLRPEQAPISCLNVGTGPGLPTLMLLELLPGLQVTAVEPSPFAFMYLQRNIARAGRAAQVIAYNTDFLTLPLNERYDLVTCIGAIHRLNTAFLLQKCRTVLRDGGLLLVADEFLSPYANYLDRNRELIRHHTAYMLAVMPEPPSSKFNATPEERELMTRLRHEVPLLAYEAERGVQSVAQRCRELLRDLRKLRLPRIPSHPVLAFYRFQLVELEALVAGLDYEVERKTFAEYFVALAESAGFTLCDHGRIYATAGFRKLDAGTHVFVFRKE